MLRDLVRGLGEDLGVGRNDTDGTRNADKPSSEFHISPFHADHTEWWSKAAATTPAWFESLSFAGAAMVCAKKAAANIAQAAAPRRVTDRSRSNSPSRVYALISRTRCLSSALIECVIIIRIKRSSPRGNASCEYFRSGEDLPNGWPRVFLHPFAPIARSACTAFSRSASRGTPLDPIAPCGTAHHLLFARSMRLSLATMVAAPSRWL